MGKMVGLILIAMALLSPAPADEVIIGEMDEHCALPFCGG